MPHPHWQWPVTNTADNSQWVSGSGLLQTQRTAVSWSPFAGSIACLTESGLPQTLQTKIMEGEAGSLYQFNQIKSIFIVQLYNESAQKEAELKSIKLSLSVPLSRDDAT